MPSSTESAKTKGARKRLPDHPPFAEMVATTIVDGDPRRGTSRQAIKRNILAQHGLPDTNHNNLFINKSLKKGLLSGKFAQVKYHRGHYKINTAKVRPAGKPTLKKTKKATAKTGKMPAEE